MFLRIKGFQVEVKEEKKSWNESILLKNFPIGKFQNKMLLYNLYFLLQDDFLKIHPFQINLASTRSRACLLISFIM